MSLPFVFRRFIVLIFLTLVSLNVSANLSCIDLFSNPPLELKDFMENPLNYSRVDYLKTLARIAKSGVSDEVYNAGGRMNVKVDGQGHVVRINHGMVVQYHPNLERVLNFLSDYPRDFKDLLVNRAILNHADEFLSFLKSCKNCKTLDPWRVYERARKVIGTTTVYRGIYLGRSDEHLAKEIQKNGFVAQTFNKENLWNISTIAENMTNDYNAQMQKHVKNDTRYSAIMSVSYRPEVSIAVANTFAKERKDGGAIYLFKLEVSKLDLIHQDEFDRPGFYEGRDAEAEMYGFHVLGKNNARIIFPDGPDLESFLLFRILASEIKEVTRITKAPYRMAEGY